MTQDLREYMLATDETAIYPDAIPEGADKNIVGLLYCATKLGGEAGEVAEQIGKALRDDGGQITDERRMAIKKEMGDVQWYLARLCRMIGIDPRDVLDTNLEKLRDRKDRGVLGGSGSDR